MTFKMRIARLNIKQKDIAEAISDDRLKVDRPMLSRIVNGTATKTERHNVAANRLNRYLLKLEDERGLS